MRHERSLARLSKINVTARLFQPADWLADWLALRAISGFKGSARTKEKGKERNYFTSLGRAFQDLQLCLEAGKLTTNEWERVRPALVVQRLQMFSFGRFHSYCHNFNDTLLLLLLSWRYSLPFPDHRLTESGARERKRESPSRLRGNARYK